ncbi:MAG: phosphotransferase [Deltaproteobacteria bacterium]|nr:MAG: phosphotransferase [Deltaproteobacteria bacterium]
MNFKKITRAPFRGVVNADSLLEDFIRDNRDPGELFSGKMRQLKSSVSARTAIVEIRLSGQSGAIKEVYAKEFFYKNLFHSLKPIFRMHRTQILWRNAWHLLQNGVSVPEPTGYLLHQSGPFCRGAYFFSEALSECMDLGTLALNKAELNRRLDTGGLIETLGAMVALLHDSGVIHGDLKWSNIMVHKKQNEIWFIDLDSLRRRHFSADVNFYLQDVARFVVNGKEVGINASIVNRFLETYAQCRKLARKSSNGPVVTRVRKLTKKRQKKYQR